MDLACTPLNGTSNRRRGEQSATIVSKGPNFSIRYVRREHAIGYNKAARLVEMMEYQGVVSQSSRVGKREVLVAER